MAAHPFPWNRETCEKFRDYLLAFGPRLLIVDTLNRAIGGLPENDAGTMGWMLGQLEELARDVNCAIVLCHHVSKNAAANGNGDPHSARGSSVIVDNARWQTNLSPPTDYELKTLKVSRKQHVHLQITKANYSAGFSSRWLRRDKEGVLVEDRHFKEGRSNLHLVPTDDLAGTESA